MNILLEEIFDFIVNIYKFKPHFYILNKNPNDDSELFSEEGYKEFRNETL